MISKDSFIYKTAFNPKVWMIAFLSFPLLDYILRHLLKLPIIPSLWDKGVILVLLLFVLFQPPEEQRTLPKIKGPLVAFIMLGVIHIFIDMPYWSASFEGFRATYQYLLALLIGFFIIKEYRDVIFYVRFLTLLGTFAALVGVGQVALGVETPASWTDASEQGLIRAFSFVISPNVLGSYLALIIPIAIGLFFLERGKWWKLIWAGSTLLCLAAFIFSGSRGAWLALFGATSLLFMFTNRKLLIASIAGALGAFLFVGPIRSRILNLLSPEYFTKSSSDGRIARWINAFNEMTYDPFFGKGIGHYGGAVGSRHFGTIYVDNYFFKTLAELGLIGFGLFVILLITLVVVSLRILKTYKGTREYFLLSGVIVGLMAVIIHNAGENIFEVPFMISYFWFLSGLLFAFPYLNRDTKASIE